MNTEHAKGVFSTSDEIDLIDLIKRINRKYNKWRKFLMVSIFIGCISGIGYFYFSPKTYQTRMYVSSNLLKGPSFIVLLDDLQRHLKEGNHEEVSKSLGLDLNTCRKIIKIEVFTAKNFAEKEFSELITQTENEEERELNNSEFVIQAFISDNNISSLLQQGIINYLNNNNFSKMKSKMKKNSLKMMLNRLQKELKELDSLKYSLNKIYINKGKTSSSSIIMNDPSAIYNNILNLFRTEIATNDDINTPDISVVQGFVNYKKQYSPRLIISTLTGIMISLILSIFYIFYAELKLKLQ
jgi:hypothetical protein